MPLADELFLAYQEHGVLKDKVIHALFEACDLNYDGDEWPLDDVKFDWYDTSFEFKGARVGWVPTMEQLKHCFQLGFKRCWLCYTDGSEAYCSDGMTAPTFRAAIVKPPVTQR